VKSALHSSETGCHGTGRPTIDLARAVLGGINLDPFSSAEWNAVIGADRFFDEYADAFSCAWFDGAPPAAEILADLAPSRRGPLATGLVNAPGDRTGRQCKNAWVLTEWHHRHGWLGGGAIWVAFTLNHLQTTQRAGAPRSLCSPDFLRCIPDHRLAYQSAPGVVGEDPTHPSAIVLLPSLEPVEAKRQRELFALLGGRLGAVI